MNNRLFITVGLLLSHSMALASAGLPSLECWDGTFAYNRLKTQINGDKLDFTSSGQDLGVFSNLVKLPADGSWGQLKITFSMPQAKCKVSSLDAKIITCQTDYLTIEAKGTVGINEKIDERVDVKNAVVQIRRVNELAIWGNETSGYELTLASNHIRSSPVLTQRYFYGLDRDETANCKIKN